MVAEEKLIVALDFPTAASALALTHELRGICRWVKVGLELFCAEGPALIRTLEEQGFAIFLDLKLHDIPNTVAGAIRSVSKSGAALLTVHAGGGPAMLERAVAEANALDTSPKLLAVTVLTSMDRAELERVGVDSTPADQVLRLAAIALKAGVPGLVCSTEEVAEVRRTFGPEPLLIVPGIRGKDVPRGDQRRVASAEEAIRAGASQIVVGRPITQAKDPRRATEAILQEIREAGEIR